MWKVEVEPECTKMERAKGYAQWQLCYNVVRSLFKRRRRSGMVHTGAKFVEFEDWLRFENQNKKSIQGKGNSKSKSWSKTTDQWKLKICYGLRNFTRWCSSHGRYGKTRDLSMNGNWWSVFWWESRQVLEEAEVWVHWIWDLCESSSGDVQ